MTDLRYTSGMMKDPVVKAEGRRQKGEALLCCLNFFFLPSAFSLDAPVFSTAGAS
jgi:hypothetical protein